MCLDHRCVVNGEVTQGIRAEGLADLAVLGVVHDGNPISSMATRIALSP